MSQMRYDKRYVASLLIEAETPLSISSGEKDLLTDSAVMKDANGLPMILGTSLAGVLRHSLQKKGVNTDSIFGFQKGKTDEGEGSRLIVSHAHFVGKDGNVIEGLRSIEWDDEFYAKFRKLPIRQHTKISDLGSADKEVHGKFDEEVVFSGTRFRFEIELIGNKSDEVNWYKLINQFNAKDFRIGGGSRKGFGKLAIKDIKEKCFDLNEGMEQYLMKPSSLNELSGLNDYNPQEEEVGDWTKYRFEIEPEDFWMFGSGLSDNEADMTPVFEKEILWKSDGPEFSKKRILIPASSLKGAISHRLAYHYNKITGKTADGKTKEELNQLVGENNFAVNTLFGNAKKNNEGRRGNVLFSDLFKKNTRQMKIFNHVAIDRFTGGAKDGALFDEKVISQKVELELEMLVNSDVLKDEDIKKAFENSLSDICTGMLPLGGGVMKGHGCFKGKLYRNGDEVNNG